MLESFTLLLIASVAQSTLLGSLVPSLRRRQHFLLLFIICFGSFRAHPK